MTVTVQPVNRWRAGDRDWVARQAHNADTTRWRRSLATAATGDRVTVARLIRTTGSIAAAAERLGVTTVALFGRASWDEDFRRTIEEALRYLCRDNERCGTERGYRAGGRCAACRRAKHARRGTRTSSRGPASPAGYRTDDITVAAPEHGCNPAT